MGLIGGHVSIAGGIETAVERGESFGFDSIQVFTRNQRQWHPPPLTEEAVVAFRDRLSRSSVRAVVSHGSYLLNLASPDEAQRRLSSETVLDEIDRCERLGIPYFVFHPGSHRGEGEAIGLQRLVHELNTILSERSETKVRILIENTAGSGQQLGGRFEQFEALLGRCRYPERIGFCFDTAHAFAAGYPLLTPEEIEKTFDEIHARVGLDRIFVFHLNDSKAPAGSHVDRHANLGEGHLGKAIFVYLFTSKRFAPCPMILETPKGEAGYADDLAYLRTQVFPECACD